MNALTITAPDDWHIHLRDGNYLQTTVKHAARNFKRAIIMPNLVPPLTQVEGVHLYYTRIREQVAGEAFTPLMTLYLNEEVHPEHIQQAKDSQIIHAVKWYPKGATTNSEAGVSDIVAFYDTLAQMSECDMPLLIHGEVTDNHIDIFARERVFIKEQLQPLVEQFPKLRIVLEHISSIDAVEFVLQAPDNVAATITAHHLWLNRNDLLAGGIRPHHYCLPIVKRKEDQQALIMAATSGNPKFFLGTDSAPHPVGAKQSACGCAGIYTAPHALALYAQIFDEFDALDKLENFASHFGADFYKLPRNQDKISLVKQPWQVPESYPFGDETVIPFMAGRQLNWQIEGQLNG